MYHSGQKIEEDGLIQSTLPFCWPQEADDEIIDWSDHIKLLFWTAYFINFLLKTPGQTCAHCVFSCPLPSLNCWIFAWAMIFKKQFSFYPSFKGFPLGWNAVEAAESTARLISTASTAFQPSQEFSDEALVYWEAHSREPLCIEKCTHWEHNTSYCVSLWLHLMKHQPKMTFNFLCSC